MSSSSSSPSVPGSNFTLAPGTFFKPPLSTSAEMDIDSPSDTASEFTPKMRDRQSRGKNPYAEHDSDVDEEVEMRVKHPNSVAGRHRRNQRKQTNGDFSAVERRQQAIAYLDNPELLMIYAQSTGDSIPAARLHFMKRMCGYDEESLEEARKDGSLSQKQPQQPQQQKQQAHQQPGRDVDKRRGGDRASGR